MSGGMKDTTTSKGIACHVKQFLEFANMESLVEALLNLPVLNKYFTILLKKYEPSTLQNKWEGCIE